MGMNFIVLVWKRVWKITFFGLKSDLKNQVAHPTKNSHEYPHPPTQACSHEQKLQKKVTLHLLEDLVGLVGKTMNKQS